MRHIARTDPAQRHQRVVRILDNASCHRGGPIEQALAKHLHLEFERLSSFRPPSSVIER